MGGYKFGRYTLIDKIATGGMAEVYRAVLSGEQGFEKIVVIKRILPHLTEEQALITSFIDEARLAALLQHENIVKTFDFGKAGMDYFMAMEYLSGKSLRAVLNYGQKLDEELYLETSLFILAKVTAGLHYAHQLKDIAGKPLNIIHRDVSPTNIFITYDGQVKIIDFGIAKTASQNTNTQFGVIKGKLNYLAPEAVLDGSVDHRADIFSLGSVMYEMLTGHRLFTGDMFQVMASLRKMAYVKSEKAAPHLPARLHAIIGRALEQDPDKRYQSCGEILEDLEDTIFELKLRQSALGLERYMRHLFGVEIEKEETTLRHFLAGTPKGGASAHDSEQDSDIMEETVLMTMVGNTSGSFERTELLAPEPTQTTEKTLPLTDSGEAPEQRRSPSAALTGTQADTGTYPKAQPAADRDTRHIFITGAFAVGKTKLVDAFLKRKFTDHYNHIAGINIEQKELRFEGRPVNFVIWELPGVDPYTKLNVNHLHNMDGCIIVVDGTRPSTLQTAMSIKELLDTVGKDTPSIMVINKVDISRQWKVDRQFLNKLSDAGWLIQRTSAKSGVGVSKAFMSLAEKLVAPKPV